MRKNDNAFWGSWEKVLGNRSFFKGINIKNIRDQGNMDPPWEGLRDSPNLQRPNRVWGSKFNFFCRSPTGENITDGKVTKKYKKIMKKLNKLSKKRNETPDISIEVMLCFFLFPLSESIF